ncbi:cytochrome P450 736A117-like [Humulus lupulus]|uniref:cytochrome P450 736A117-like n=1 Tax=Humulus lupulus TaxID=3486 RepID=UPI002B4168D8|nr:cytochrome P450 736A117-like [Humulus lupulus]
MSNLSFLSSFLVPIIATVIFTISLIKRLIFTLSNTTQKNLPPSPRRLPILGNLHQLGLYPYRTLQQLAQHHGPLMLVHFGSRPVLVVSSADAAREIMKTHDVVFSNRPKLSMAHKLLYQARDISTAPYGEYWRQMRSICMLHLLSPKRVHSFRSVREEEAALMVELIKRQCFELSLPVNLSEMFSSYTNDVICRVVFGRKYEGAKGGTRFKELLGDLMRLLGSVCVGDYITWLSWVNYVNGTDRAVEKVAKAFDSFLDSVVEEHMEGFNYNNEGQDRKNFVDILLEIQENTKMAGFSVSKDNIKAIILDMFAAGTDTTYTVLEWAMTELLKNPIILKKLQSEVSEVANGKSDISEEDLEKMVYLKAIMKETLRLYPPIPLLVPRESTQDIKIKGFDIAAGTMVMTNAWAIGRDTTLWDQPDLFQPERFIDSEVDFKAGSDHFQLIPFGAGRRGCPGILFAMVSNELVLAKLVHKFDWTLLPGVDDLDMRECVGLTIHREVPLIAIATPK